MKKFRFFRFVLAILAITSFGLTSCEKDDDGGYYAGESAEDYKPNTYTISSVWDFGKVSGLTTAEKKEAEKSLAEACNGSKVFDTRKDAVAAFDATVEQLSKGVDSKEYKGLVCKLTLSRGSAIIKTSKIEW